MIQEIKPWLCWRSLPVKVLAGTTVISKVFWERICFQVHSRGCWLASRPYWLFIETSTPCHIGLSTWQFTKCSWLSLEWVIEQKKEYLRWKTLSLYYLILEVSLHHFGHFLFISRASPHPKGGIQHRYKYQEAENHWRAFREFLPHLVN